MTPLEFVLAAFGISLVAGGLGSLLGLGGGIIVVPALTLLLGIDIRVTNVRMAGRLITGRAQSVNAAGLRLVAYGRVPVETDTTPAPGGCPGARCGPTKRGSCQRE